MLVWKNSAAEFESAVDDLEAFIDARAGSIRKQLDGSLSSRNSEQDASARVDASGVDISAKGSQDRFGK